MVTALVQYLGYVPMLRWNSAEVTGTASSTHVLYQWHTRPLTNARVIAGSAYLLGRRCSDQLLQALANVIRFRRRTPGAQDCATAAKPIALQWIAWALLSAHRRRDFG
jgi:hypothetical protein